jgi:hypothetical protein
MTKDSKIGGGKKPSERDSKICPVCNKPFTWRKKWSRDWENVIYCSDRCRKARV